MSFAGSNNLSTKAVPQYHDENAPAWDQDKTKLNTKNALGAKPQSKFEIRLPRRNALADVSNLRNPTESEPSSKKRSLQESQKQYLEGIPSTEEELEHLQTKKRSKSSDNAVSNLDKGSQKVASTDTEFRPSNPLMVEEYEPEIFSYMESLESKCLPSATYMDKQQELTWKMREILNEWLVEIHTNFCLMPETLFLAVNIVDRFLSLRACSLTKFQLIGISALLIASKYEEVMCPSIQNFVYMTDGAFTAEDVCTAERYILRVLDYDLGFPSPLNLIRRISKCENYDVQTRTLGKYLTEIYLFEHRLLQYRPSMIAASSMYLARRLLRRGPWGAELVKASGGYEEHTLKPVAFILLQYHNKPVEHKAFFQKYASKKNLKASVFVHQLVRQRFSVAHNADDEIQSDPSSSINSDGH
ncbi:G1/S-specific B-type cyclin Cig2 [Schizosaccharomyces octosporus yFS286]|uniref:G1/S-specific B-type cyclin Cig2 n=1 Tax=Schizosaccharomyces octosporus (strain yFS286) TaxID=483514 RepID=S9Q5F3_SCHOY|nr:G1/S-specific B-type cyclin Cig2 [Schizosaccharomyces octosporus yFS286]EPX75287.1 G1/S-specific B-type cyclin Cig2 [Schizosaccharomyces octosporus yFS286]